MVSMTDQLIAIVVFGVFLLVFPWAINKWSDSRAQVR
jgi:hypothetical protein